MTDPVLRLDGIGKYYRLGGMQPYQTLRDSIASVFRRPKHAKEKDNGFWALRDISFELKEGEVLGIVGRNGAGKSTLLKILSRITTPDEGCINVRGRIGSLLEVGTGFHPELTGRENIFMNGVLLGMSRQEVAQKFDEIVVFSGVEQFLDTPVKRYSSGMRVRLGFAVAAHLDPEILIIDEVLAVGDAEFQRKCLGRMNVVASEGRTVLFVSHQMEAIQSLCSRAILLRSGKIQMDGSAKDVVSAYLLELSDGGNGSDLDNRSDRTGKGDVRISSINVDDGAGNVVMTGSASQFSLNFIKAVSDFPIGGIVVRIAIRDHMDRVLALLSNELTGTQIVLTGNPQAQCHIKSMPLVPGRYLIDVSIWINDVLQDKVFRASVFDIYPGDFHGSGKTIHVGIMHFSQSWSVKDVV